MDDLEKRMVDQKASRAFSQPFSQADMDAFERVLRRLDDSELRGFMMACELYMTQRLANAAPKPDPIAL